MLKYFTLQLSLIEQSSSQLDPEEKLDKVTQIAEIVHQMMEWKRDDWADFARLKKDLRKTMTKLVSNLDGVRHAETAA